MTIGQHLDLVPKDPLDNLFWRGELLKQLDTDPKAADDIWLACQQDILFYVNFACFTHDPRLKVAEVPFITWDFQDKAIDELQQCIATGKDCCIAKSRDMGASWLILVVIKHLIDFDYGKSALIGSRNETYVDDPGNKKALFQRLDFIHDRTPICLQPRDFTRVKLHYGNKDTEGTIDGESTTGKFGRGDRRTVIMLDEFAAFEIADGYAALSSTQFATDCRIFNSTYESTSDAFYQVSRNDSMHQIRLHWSAHPVHNKGLYVDAEGTRRSPWYDLQCEKAGDKRIIAKDLDMNPEGAMSQFFIPSEIDKLLVTTTDPVVEGDIDFDSDTARNPRFNERKGGPLKLWFDPIEGMAPPNESYAIGADISAGTGATNTAFSGVNRMTGHKLVEWVDPNTRPEQAAKVCVALARWLNDALIIPEAPGPGRSFIDVIVTDLSYGNIYFEQQERKVTKEVTTTPGWNPTPDNRWRLYTEYRRALNDGHFINYSRLSLEECRGYVYFAKTIWHVDAISGNDPSGARENHGDRPTADALAWKGVRYSPVSESAQPNIIPSNSIGGRRQMQRRKLMERQLAWQ